MKDTMCVECGLKPQAQRPGPRDATIANRDAMPGLSASGVIRCSDLLGGNMCNLISQNRSSSLNLVAHYEIPRERDNPKQQDTQKQNDWSIRNARLITFEVNLGRINRRPNCRHENHNRSQRHDPACDIEPNE